jgi:uroporphyrinogen-III synthase
MPGGGYADGMPTRATPGWYVISLRPRGEHAPLRRAAARAGAGVIALSPTQLQLRDDDATRRALHEALAAPRVLFTSPLAVRAARALQPLRALAGQQWFAVGAGTAAALRRAGVDRVESPSRMDSEGLLSLPGLSALDGTTLGFVTAPGGRGMLIPTLQARGAHVIRADVYERQPVAPTRQSVERLAALRGPAVLALSSGEALEQVLACLPEAALQRLREAHVVAASERLAQLARDAGLRDPVVAGSARPADLIAAARTVIAPAA